jgi:pSer/pThr/pTyr-binding forkhead associated (FHA) protein
VKLIANNYQFFPRKIFDELGEEVAFYLGRGSDCAIQVDHQSVSRKAVKFSLENGKIFVEKEGGEVFINQVALSKHQLKNGDVLKIGILNFQIEADEEEIEGAKGKENKEEAEFLDSANKEESENDIEEKSEEEFVSGENAFEADQNSENVFNAEDDHNFLMETDSSEVNESENEQDEKTEIFRSYVSFELKISGEFAPYDRFVINSPIVTIGRDGENSIPLQDPEASGKHARLEKNGTTIQLIDLQSSNGTLLNGKRVNQDQINDGDEFLIGSTSFELKVVSQELEKEKDSLIPIGSELLEEVIDDSGEGLDFSDKKNDEDSKNEKNVESKSLFSKEALKDPEKRKKILIGLVVLIGAWVLLDDGKKEVTVKEGKPAEKIEEKEKIDISKSLSSEQLQILEATYQLSVKLVEQGKLREALNELEKIIQIAPDYKQTSSLMIAVKEGLAKIEELEKKQQEEEARRLNQIKISEMVEKLKVAVSKREVELANALMGKILELDPENFDVPPLKSELDSWVRDQERLAIEKAQKEAERKRQVEMLSPSKVFFEKKEWHNAITKLEQFILEKNLDEDLRNEALDLFKKAKENLEQELAPVIGKARSFKEAQDLKSAYESYENALKIDPNHEESINEMATIRDTLRIRAMKIFREGLIEESLTLFDAAKEKFLEVKQVAPKDSEYYLKAEEKLKKYLE